MSAANARAALAAAAQRFTGIDAYRRDVLAFADEAYEWLEQHSEQPETKPSPYSQQVPPRLLLLVDGEKVRITHTVDVQTLFVHVNGVQTAVAPHAEITLRVPHGYIVGPGQVCALCLDPIEDPIHPTVAEEIEARG